MSGGRINPEAYIMNNTNANQPLSAFEEKAAPRRGAIREFAAFYKPHMGMFLLDMFCALIIALVDILFPVVTRKVLYDYIPNQAMRTFLIVMGAMLIAFLIRTGAQWVVTYLGHLTGVHIEADMRAAIFAHMQKLGFSFYDKNRTGLLMSRVTTDLFDITELAHHGPEDLFISIVTLTGSFLVLWRIQKKLALVLMIAVPVIVVFVAMRRRSMMKVSRDVKRRTAGINAEIESSISGIRVAKAFGNEDEEIDKFTHCTNQYVSAKQGYYKVMAGFFSGTELMMNLMSLSVIFVGSYLIMKDQMDIATLVTFNMYVASVQSPIRKLTQFTEQFTQGMAGFQRFRAIMHEDPDIVDAPDAVGLDRVDGDIEFHDVSFSYDEGKGDVLLFEDEMSGDSLRKLCDAVTNHCGGRCAVFAGADGAYKYAIGHVGGDLRELTKKMNAALNGRGGGKPNFVQGSVAAARGEIERFFVE